MGGPIINNKKAINQMDDLLLAASTASTLFNLLVIFCAFRLFKRSGDTMHVFIISKELFFIFFEETNF
jgi:hypothetical protein